MGIYDYIIVGGGISGLFTAYKLSQTGESILIVESTTRLGGRVFTKKEKGVQFECGAGRISSNHTKVMNLIKQLKLDKQLIKLPDKIQYKVKHSRINYYSLVDELIEGSKLYTKKYLQSINLLQLCIDVLGFETATLFKNILGYDSEFQQLNAYQALKSYNKDLFSPSEYYVMDKGLSSITDTLGMILQDKSNVTILMDTIVSDIGKNYIQIDTYKQYGSTIICCVPYDSLVSFPKFKEVQSIRSVTPIPLIRIYAKYPKDKSGKVWFHNLPRTITDNYIRQIIPIDYESGLIMISYTDGIYADMWNNLCKQSNKVLIDHLHREIKDVLGKEPPKPEFITNYYWSAGVHMWKPGCDVKKVYKQLLQPFPNENIYLVNEAFSLHQCWIEGALDMSYDVLELIDTNFKRSKPKKGGGLKRKSKVYTINQVLKKRTWIVLDIKHQLRIFNVSKWLQSHPGGMENLKRGIRANKFYKNPKKYPESPIQLFKQISAHSSANVLKNMLVDMNNPLVSYIGIMKKV
jgi:hypothetical protein